MLDRYATDVVGFTEGTVLIHEHLGHDEQGNALAPCRRPGNPRKDEVDDVRGEVMVSIGYEDLLAEDAVVIAVLRVFRGHRARFQQREVGARLRLGEVHRARPRAAHELREEILLLRVGAAHDDGFDRAARERRRE